MVKKGKSGLEAEFALQIRALRLPEPEVEHRFHKTRRWRFDFAWPDKKIAVEVDGGTYSQGRHTRGSGFHNDCQKLNEAVLLGWRVLRGDSKMVKSLDLVRHLERALE